MDNDNQKKSIIDIIIIKLRGFLIIAITIIIMTPYVLVTIYNDNFVVLEIVNNISKGSIYAFIGFFFLYIMINCSEASDKLISLAVSIILIGVSFYSYQDVFLLMKDKKIYDSKTYPTVITNDYYAPINYSTRNKQKYIETIYVNDMTLDAEALKIRVEDYNANYVNRTLAIDYLPNSGYIIRINTK